MMEIVEAVLSAGVWAVLSYRSMSGIDQDNEVPERFLSSMMGVYLHQVLGQKVRVERKYQDIATDLGLSPAVEDMTKIHNLFADIAVYVNSKPRWIVEIKKFAETNTEASVHDDLHKGDPVNLRRMMECYAGVLICETAHQALTERQARIERVTGVSMTYSLPQIARKGEPAEWKWCFGCGLIRTEN
jgi:hypothetical protein